MRDDFLTRDWADNHQAVGKGIRHLIDAARLGFTRLNAIKFAAPWRPAKDGRSQPCA